MTQHISCGTLITPFQALDDMLLTVDEGKISSIEHVCARRDCPCGYPHRTDTPSEAIDAGEDIVAPGFIDIHVHGGGGFDTMDATFEALDGMSLHLARAGVTAFVPTTITAPWEDSLAAAEAVEKAMEAGTSGAQILGIHLEGPYINLRRKGAQPAEFVREPSVDEFRDRVGKFSSVVRIVTLAPELPGVLDLIRYLSARNIVVSMGHSDATFEQAVQAIDAGASHACHLFNAMRPFLHREPGIVGAVLADDRVRAEIVWDDLHLHPGTARAVVNAKRPEGVMLVSDAMRAAGLEDGEYDMGGQQVFVRDGAARLADGTIAGSIITLDAAVRNAARFFPVHQAVMMASYVPAYGAGVEREKGSIAVGRDADLVILSQDLRVRGTMMQGRLLREA